MEIYIVHNFEFWFDRLKQVAKILRPVFLGLILCASHSRTFSLLHGYSGPLVIYKHLEHHEDASPGETLLVLVIGGINPISCTTKLFWFLSHYLKGFVWFGGNMQQENIVSWIHFGCLVWVKFMRNWLNMAIFQITQVIQQHYFIFFKPNRSLNNLAKKRDEFEICCSEITSWKLLFLW